MMHGAVMTGLICSHRLGSYVGRVALSGILIWMLPSILPWKISSLPFFHVSLFFYARLHSICIGWLALTRTNPLDPLVRRFPAWPKRSLSVYRERTA